jgi:hypothetical protein
MKLSPFEFIVAALCVYRISLMVVREKGPGHVFKKAREVPSKRSKVYDWLTCVFCFSMTASGLVCIGIWLTGHREHWAHWGIIWCALSAVAIMIHMRFNSEEP